MSDTVDQRELRALVRSIEEAGWDYARVELNGVTLVVSQDPDLVDREQAGAAPEGTAAPAEAGRRALAPSGPVARDEPREPEVRASEPAADSANGDEAVETVTSPSIGLFWRSPKPGAPPFVEVGQSVAAGDTVCIIEVMKLMTHVAATTTGTVRRIHVNNGEMVEHGTPLVDILPLSSTEGQQ